MGLRVQPSFGGWNLKHLLILAAAATTLCVAPPAFAQVTNDSLLGMAEGQAMQRMQDQTEERQNDERHEQRERALERCLAIVDGGAPLPDECRALIPKPVHLPELRWPWSHRPAPKAEAEAAPAPPPPAPPPPAPVQTEAAPKAQCGMVPVPGGVKLVPC
jgi:hypothetical protein